MKFLLIRTAEIKKKTAVIPYPFSHPPLGLLYVAAAIEHAGHTVEIIDYLTDSDATSRIKNIVESVDAIGITLTIDQVRSAADVTSKIRANHPEIPIILGGPHCTILPVQTLVEIKDADLCVVGDGEIAILGIIQWLQGDKELSEIRGIFFREGQQIKQGRPPQMNENLDHIHLPARHLIKGKRYGVSRWGFSVKHDITSITTSRGCPFNCRFCANSSLKATQNYRIRSAEDVYKEIQQVAEEYQTIVIVDDNFLADLRRAHHLFNLIIDSDLKLDFIIEGARVDSANEDLYRKMKQAGVTTILFGIESGNQDVLDYYQKGVKLEQIRHAINLAHKINFFVCASFILGAPIETKHHIQQTIQFACSLPIDYAIFNPLRYQAGSQLWKDAVNDKKLQVSQYNIIADKTLGLSQFTRKELLAFTDIGYKTFYFRPRYILHQFSEAVKRKDITIFLNGIKFYTFVQKW
jgi:anaerobic magnesium-protoporphyrin IX monomethyl ester cyclase